MVNNKMANKLVKLGLAETLNTAKYQLSAHIKVEKAQLHTTIKKYGKN